MLHTYHRSISLEFFKQCCHHSLTCFWNHKNKCCDIHTHVTNINKTSMGAFVWKSTRQILVISITTSQTCPGGCYIHNNITNSNKTKSCYIHNNVTNPSSSIIQKYTQLTRYQFWSQLHTKYQSHTFFSVLVIYITMSWTYPRNINSLEWCCKNS